MRFNRIDSPCFFSSVYASLAGHGVLALNKLSRREAGVLMKLFSRMELTSACAACSRIKKKEAGRKGWGGVRREDPLERARIDVALFISFR